LIEEEVAARDFHVGREYISKFDAFLLKMAMSQFLGYWRSLTVLLLATHTTTNKNTWHVLISMASYIDGMHSKGASVTYRRLRNWFFAATKFIPLCDGISGTIGTLVVDAHYVEDVVLFPIDALVVDFSQMDDDVIDEDGICRSGVKWATNFVVNARSWEIRSAAKTNWMV
jgi:hypothetical protein